MGASCYLTACKEDAWETAQEVFAAKTKLFVGSESEVREWYKSKWAFTDVIKAWEDGKAIQFSVNNTYEWQDIPEGVTPQWFTNDGYRVKPEEKKYRPYESSAEMVVDFIDRFKVNCPSYCEPLIWIKGKETDKRSLVIGFSPKDNRICVDGGRCDLLSLFTLYTYLDGSPVGMEIKK